MATRTQQIENAINKVKDEIASEDGRLWLLITTAAATAWTVRKFWPSTKVSIKDLEALANLGMTLQESAKPAVEVTSRASNPIFTLELSRAEAEDLQTQNIKSVIYQLPLGNFMLTKFDAEAAGAQNLMDQYFGPKATRE
jgi:hypothetical protein